MAAAGGGEDQCRYRTKYRKNVKGDSKNYCKNVSGDNDVQFCQKHFNFHINFLRNNPSIIKERQHHLLQSETLDLTTKNNEEKMKQQQGLILPADEQRCCMNDGIRWRCKNFRMIKSFDADDTYKYCENHLSSKIYYRQQQQLKKKRSKVDDDDDEFDSDIETRDSKCLKRQRKQEDDLIGGIQPSKNHTTRSERIVGGGCAKMWANRKKRTERSRGKKSSTGISEPVVETKDSKCLKRQQPTEEDDRTGGIQSPTNHTCSDGIVGGGSTNVETTRKQVETTSGELKSLTGIREPVIEMESLEHYKTKCIELSVELEKKNLELENKNVECTKLHGKYEKKELELEKKNLEIEKMKLEFEMKNLEFEKKNVECTKLHGKYEKKELELETNKVELEKQKEELEKHKLELEKKNVECTILRGKYAELETGETGAKDEDAVNYWKNKCSDFESLVQRMEVENSKNSLVDLTDILSMKYGNRNNEKEMKWKSEPELLSSFEEDPELCMKAVCALYRQEIIEDGISPKGLYIHSDTLRCTTLAKFLMNEDCKGDLKKFVAELETLDSKAVGDCKKLARRYSMHLFDIYQNRKDPFFRPATTDGN